MSGSWASSEYIRRSMRANKGRDTKPELAVRRLLHASGLRYRVNAKPEGDLRRTVDILFRPARVAVLIDGCYWHGCPQHYIPPRANGGYWSDKVTRNRARDEDTNRVLTERGWLVLRFWEHESPAAVADQIIAVVSERRPRPA